MRTGHSGLEGQVKEVRLYSGTRENFYGQKEGSVLFVLFVDDVDDTELAAAHIPRCTRPPAPAAGTGLLGEWAGGWGDWGCRERNRSSPSEDSLLGCWSSRGEG